MTSASHPPRAAVVPERRFSLSWMLPAAAGLLVVFFAYQAWDQRGIPITVHLAQGHGLKVDDGVRFRGIQVGRVSEVGLDESLGGVVLEVLLFPEGRSLARAGSRFWVVRPEVSVAGVVGLETIVGARYLAVLPGPEGAPSQTEFEGLDGSPALMGLETGGVEVLLYATRGGSLRAGTPVNFRQLQVGRVLSVGLASDSNAVEARIYVEPAFAPLVREGTRFWRASGIDLKADFTGLELKTESLQSLVLGGVSMATPEDAGREVSTGHGFELNDRPDKEWLEWQPSIPIGSSLLPAGVPLPRPLKAVVTWDEGTVFTDMEQRQGWLLPLEGGLLGPVDMLSPDEDADEDSAVLEVAGQTLRLGPELLWREGGVGVLPASLSARPWPTERRRRPELPEDCLLVGDPTATTLAVASTRLEVEGPSWVLSGSIPVDESWHGAVVLARSDGALLGVLLMDDSDARVALLP